MLSFELENEFSVVQCEIYDFRTNLFVDPRYSTIGYTSLYELQDSNGIY